ncbi:MAG: electron transfer flavoprotein subunit beta/FixA family protein [Kineosporiaceae bacterium]
MDVVVLVKYVPDAQEPRSLGGQAWRLDRTGETGRLSELDEYAVEVALRLVEEHGGSVRALTVGPEEAAQALRTALQMGADEALHVCDPALAGGDALATARLLAAALERLRPDLVVTGMSSTDAATGLVPAAVAELSGWALLAQADQVEAEGHDGAWTLRIERDAGGAVATLEASAPVVLSVTDRSGEPRYPSFRTIMAAKKKRVQRWGPEEVTGAGGLVSPDLVGQAGARTRVLSARPLPARAASRRMVAPAEAPAAIADLLHELELL